MVDQFENNYTTLLNGAIDDDDTTIEVDAGPVTMTGDFRIKIEDELIMVGVVSGTTFTDCERGIEGTTAASHADDSTVSHVLTAEGLLSVTDEIDIGVLNLLLKRRPAVNAQDDHFNETSLDGKWTVISGSADLTTLPGWLRSSGALYIQQAVPAGDWTIESEVVIPSLLSASFSGIGIYLSNSATGTGTQKVFKFAGSNNVAGYMRLQFMTMVNLAFSTQFFAYDVYDKHRGHRFLRIRKSGTTYSVDSSDNRSEWYNVGSTGSLGITPTHFGIWAEATGALVNYFLRY